MSYPSGTKLICIDATPIPIRCGPGISSLDFTFPNGFLQEGASYCVERSIQNPDGSCGLFLTGLPLYLYDREANWHHLRFRKSRSQKKELAKSEKELKQSVEKAVTK